MFFLHYILPILIFIGLGLFAGISLSIVSTVFAVPKNEKLIQVSDALPGINCGACGYSGCDEYAKKILDGDPINLCTPGGDSVASELGKILDREFEDVVEKVAFVRCTGSPQISDKKYEYSGTLSCAGAAALYGGHGDCAYKCLGYGDCVSSCIFDAIHIVDNIAVIDREKCTGCISCVNECPKGIIGMKEGASTVFIACANRQNAKEVRKICKQGCIACGRCVRECKSEAITINDNLANIDYDKCTNCGKCTEVCPVKCIKLDI